MKKIINIVKYSISSLSSSGIDLLLFQFLCAILRESSNRHHIIIATIIARIVSSIYNYLLNYVWVFESKTKYTSSIIKYFTLVAVQMVISSCLVTWLYQIVNIKFELIIKIPIDLFLFVVNYVIQKKVVF